MATNNAINGDVPLVVQSGGTGRATLASHSTLAGNGSTIFVNSAGLNGTTIIAKTGGQPAMANPTSTASSLTLTTNTNALNFDIEEYKDTTSWTPGLRFGGGSSGSSTVVGTYRRLGKNAFITGKITVTSVAVSSLAVTVTGLPVGSNSVCTLNVSFSKLTYVGQLMAYVASGASMVTFVLDTGSGVSAALIGTAFQNGTVLIISGNITTV